MKRRILLTGKTGQVGSELLRLLPRLGEVVAPDRLELDLLNANDIRRAVREIRPEVIINAAAHTAVDAAETQQVDACALNANAPAVFAEEAMKLGAVLIHYSTDYVFDGSTSTPYEETDLVAPINVYGKTKLAGEQAIHASGVPHLIFRTAWVYATQGRNFLLTILRLATEREELRIVRDQFGAPTCSREIAEATVKILTQLTEQNSDLSTLLSQRGGTYHMTAQGATNWYEFACAILEEATNISSDFPWFAVATRGRPLIARRVIPITTTEFPTPASRPAFSLLSNSRLIRTFGFGLPDWRTQLRLVFKPEYSTQVHGPRL
ncbi:MAG TPA: dTDP-4-dehydrorhamnose reductase [Candidatus Sulfotelmatobacter sp.]|jgi:dTDP-4-dehydrorhamnose reductase|nr:dTDP-4-dehydrorhamnose reductase [Candidatus Sulfotelmatobacter sp.]